MFDLALQVRMKQARAALREGRLDEAYAIARDPAVREHRGGQLLLEDLVQPFLARAAKHLEEGRPREALVDVERAIEAGGNRPEALDLRDRIEGARRERDAAKRRELEIVESARRHLLVGSLRAGEDLLKDGQVQLSEAHRLQRELGNRERRAERAAAQAGEHLGRGDLLEAILSVEELLQVCPKHESLPRILSEVKKAAAAAVRAALGDGRLAVACQLFGRLQAVLGDRLEVDELRDAVALASVARSALRGADLHALRDHLEALRRLVPSAGWVDESLAAVRQADDALRTLRAGPLGGPADLGPTPAGSPRQEPSRGEPTMALPPSDPAADGGRRGVAAAAGRAALPAVPAQHPKLLLWVDGVGTFLLLRSDRVSIGRAGGSSHPDIALAADIASRHVDILRIDEDYFVVAAEEPVAVDGRPTQRKLLASGECIDLGPRCRIKFEVPTPLSATAVLSLHRGQRVHGDVRKVLLVKDHLILGPEGKSHVELGARAEKAEKIVLSFEANRVVCRSRDDIFMNGAPLGNEAQVALGTRFQVGDVTFTLTDSTGGRQT